MPRIYTSQSDPLDFCRVHFPNEKNAEARFGKLGDGPDERGNCFAYDAEHPSYDETDYRCHSCRRRLSDKDN
jgi:hypothetical protein